MDPAQARCANSPHSENSGLPRRSCQHRWRRWLTIVCLILIVLLIGGELYARFGLGLGDPPLLRTHDQIEYLAIPSRQYRRYGNTVTYNAYSMRSADFPTHKHDEEELRVLFFGDSIINGGSLTDQAELATELLRERLAQSMKQPVVVGNISAGSWGPANLLAYAKAYGLFGADIVVIVLSSHDYLDHPTFEPAVGKRPRLPDHTPLLALEELVTRFLPIYLRRFSSTSNKPKKVPDPKVAIKTMNCLRELIWIASQSGAAVLVAQHATLQEVRGEQLPGHDIIRQAVRQMGIEPISCLGAFQASVRQGVNPYRDWIHPNVVGQQVLADILFEPIREAASARLLKR